MCFTPFTGLGAQRSVRAPSMQPAARSGSFRRAACGQCVLVFFVAHDAFPPHDFAAAANLLPKFCVEAKVMTRRESLEKRHKRIRSKVRRAAASTWSQVWSGAENY